MKNVVEPENWRLSLLALVLKVTLGLGALVYVPSLWISLRFRFYGIAVVDTVAIAAIAALWYYDRISFRARATGLAAILYMLGGALLVGVGSVSQIYLFGFSLLTVLFLGLRAGLVAVALNGVTMVVVGYFGFYGADMAIPRWPGNFVGWLIITINFLLVNTLLTLALGAVVATLEKTLVRALAARHTLENEQQGLITANQTLALEVKERIRAEEALREKEALLRVAGESARLGGWTVELSDGSVIWSDEVCDLHEVPRGTRPQVTEGLDYYEPEYRRNIVAAIMQCGLDGTPFDVESKLIGAKGTHLWVRTTGSAVHDDKGVVIRIQGAFQDISARKHAEDQQQKLEGQLRQAQKMDAVGRLAGGVAHDFNNMLGVILGHAQLMLDTLEPSDSRHGDMEELIHAAERSAALTSQLLAFARQQTISPKILDLNDTIEKMLKMLMRLIGENIQLIWRPSPSLSRVRMDATQLDQILANLVVNARDAIVGVGMLIIETSDVTLDAGYCELHPGATPGPYVQLIVSDNGRGMSAEIQRQLFEPFFTTKDLGKGTGLGLATVYGVVKQNGGFISVYSEMGQGSTFRIYFPQCESGETRTEAPRVTGVPMGTETVLLVEDEEGLLKLAKRILVDLGYRVLASSDPRTAVAMAVENGPVDLLITDVIMPHVSGREVWQSLRATMPGLKCLYMSGYTADVITDRGVLDEGVHFLQKPFTTQSLANKVRQALKGS